MNLFLEHTPVLCSQCFKERSPPQLPFVKPGAGMRALLSLLPYIFIYLILLTWVWGSWVSQLALSGNAIALEVKKPFIRKPLKTELLVGLLFSWQLIVCRILLLRGMNKWIPVSEKMHPNPSLSCFLCSLQVVAGLPGYRSFFLPWLIKSHQ